MKRLPTFIFILLSAVAALFGAVLKDGTYSGQALGYHGPLRVAVEIKGGEISRIELVHHKERRARAMKSITRQIVSKQSVDVDAVSGATISCRAVVAAVKNALDQAH